MRREKRRSGSLWGAVASPTPVLAFLNTEQPNMEVALDEATAARDDVYWAAVAFSPFTWQTFLNWWVARRWVIPRDVRKQ